MEMFYYTIAAVVLYFVSDYILNTIEIRIGKRLPSRSFIFLIIITILSLVSFSFIKAIYGPLPNNKQTTQNTTAIHMEQANKPATKETKK